MVQVRHFAHMPRPPFVRYAPQPRSRLHSIQPFALAGNGVRSSASKSGLEARAIWEHILHNPPVMSDMITVTAE
jgi:hypothetical protein